jgi:hypothetical protein
VGDLGSYRLEAGATAVLAYPVMPMVRWVAIRSGVLARPSDRFAAHPVPARELHLSRFDPAASSQEHRRLIPVQRNRRRCLPDALAALLVAFAPCFTARTFPTFQALVAGLLAQPGLRTVTGMLTGAGWPVGATTTWPIGSSPPPAGA